MAFLASTFVGTLGTSVASSLGIAGPITAGTAGTIGAATLAGGTFAAFKGTQALGSLLTKGLGLQQPQLPAIPPTPTAPPTFEQAQGTSIEEQRKNLRRKSNTILTSPSGALLEPTSVVGKSLLGA